MNSRVFSILLALSLSAPWFITAIVANSIGLAIVGCVHMSFISYMAIMYIGDEDI